MNTKNNEMAELHAYYDKVELIAAWEKEHDVPFEERITYWFGDYAMDAPKYEHKDEIDGMYDRIISQGHPLLNTGSAVYRQSEAYARAHGELEAYENSDKQNAACAGAIDRAVQASRTTLYIYDGDKVAENANGYDLEVAARSVAAEYGAGRAAWVLANVICEKRYDGRFSFENRQWARAFPIPVEHKPSFTLNTPSVVLDGFTSEARKIFEEQVREHTPTPLPDKKASVMDQIREARKSPAPPSPKKEQDKGAPGPEI